MTNMMNYELNSIYGWVNTNRFSLNINKTYCMLFNSKRNNSIHNFELKISDQIISLVNSTKFLGTIIDSKLSWEGQINYIRKKIAKGREIIYKAINSLNSYSLTSLYYSFIYPYITYAIEIWGSLPSTKLLPILKLQKRAVRIISFSA